MFSRKLATAVAGMVTIAAIVLVPAVAEVNVPLQVQLTGEVLVAGLGGLNVLRQGAIDSTLAKTQPSKEAVQAAATMASLVTALEHKDTGIPGSSAE